MKKRRREGPKLVGEKAYYVPMRIDVISCKMLD